MSDSSKSFDFRQVLDELAGFVKTQVSNPRGNQTAHAPSTTQIQHAVLSAVASQPLNQVQVISAVTTASAGSWTPTPAQVHSALAALEAAGFVVSTVAEDRKVYSITETGSDELTSASNPEPDAEGDPSTESSGTGNTSWFAQQPWMQCDPAFLRAAAKLAPVLNDVAKTATKGQQQQATQVLLEARNQLHQILAQD